MRFQRISRLLIGASLPAVALSGCASTSSAPQLPPASFVATQEGPGEEYIIGPLDNLTIFVWRNPELGAKVQVRPDGRITTPLITDMPAVGKTPKMLSDDIKLALTQYIENPLVSVIVDNFSGTYTKTIFIKRPYPVPGRCRRAIYSKCTQNCPGLIGGNNLKIIKRKNRPVSATS